jgi:hypothetical protein
LALRRKPYPVAKITGGLDVSIDPLFLSDQASPNLDVIRFDKQLLKKDLGFRTFGSIPERPMYLDMFYKSDGTSRLMLMSKTKAYTYNTNTKEFVAITGSNVFTGGDDDLFSSTTWPASDLFIVTNGKDPIQKWDGTTWAALGGLTNITAKIVIPFYTHLILGHTVESGYRCPFRIMWSAVGNPEQYNASVDPTAGAVDLCDTPDWVMAFCPLGDRLFIFKERSIWEMVHVGEPKIFDFRLLVDGVGTMAPYSPVCIGEEIIFFGTDSVYIFDGVSLKSVSDPVFPILYDTSTKVINTDVLARSPSVYVEETGDYIIVLPTTTVEPDLMLKYNVFQNTWSRRRKSVVCLGYWSITGFLTWDDVTGNWDDDEWASITWDRTKLPPGAPITFFGLPDGTIEEDDRLTKSTEEMVWETKEWKFERAQRLLGAVIYARGSGPFTVDYSLDEGFSWVTGKELTPDPYVFSELRYELNITVPKIRFRIRTTAEDFELQWIEPWYIPRARSMAEV